VRAFDWADFAERCNIERRLLVREMNRMIKVVRKQLPSLLAWPDYTEGERGVLRGICDFSLRQADQMEDDARFVTQVKLS
jgi:serine/threonine-protein kinase HipA